MFFQDPPNGPSGSKPPSAHRKRDQDQAPSPGPSSTQPGSTANLATFATFSSPQFSGLANQDAAMGKKWDSTSEGPKDEQDRSMEEDTDMEVDITPTQEQGLDLRRAEGKKVDDIGDVHEEGAGGGTDGPASIGGSNGVRMDQAQSISGLTYTSRKPSFRLPSASFQNTHHTANASSASHPSATNPDHLGQASGISSKMAQNHPLSTPTPPQRFNTRNFSDHRERRNSMPDTPNGQEDERGREVASQSDSDQDEEQEDPEMGDREGQGQNGDSSDDTDMIRELPESSSTGQLRLPSISSPSQSNHSGTFSSPTSVLPQNRIKPSGPASPSPSSSSPFERARTRPTALPPPMTLPTSTSAPKITADPFNPYADIPAKSPWAHLARTSGAPTPRTERSGGPDPFSAFFGSAATEGPDQAGGQGRKASDVSPAGGNLGSRSGSGSNLGGPFGLMNIGSLISPAGPLTGANLSGSALDTGLATPSIVQSGKADPFASFSIGSNGSGGGGGVGNGNAGMNSLLAKRTGSKSGLSGLWRSQGQGQSQGETYPPSGAREEQIGPKDMVKGPSTSSSSSCDPVGLAFGTTEMSGKAVPQGAVYGQSRRIGTGSLDALAVPNASGGGMKLNFPGGLAARRAPGQAGSSAGSSPSSEPTTNLNRPLAVLIPSPLTPSALPSLLATPESTLVLDLRPPSSFMSAHIPFSLSLPISSTLIKRPGFTLSKLADMLDPLPAQTIKKFRERKNIVIVDQDSSAASANSNLTGLASKFANASKETSQPAQGDFKGKIWFLRGGIASCSNFPGLKLVAGPEGESEMDGGHAAGSKRRPSDTDRMLQPSIGGKIAGGLDKLAFQQVPIGSIKGVVPRRATLGKAATSTTPGLAVNKFSLRLPGQTSNLFGSIGRPPSPRAEQGPEEALQPANPFFDNIRQNLELSHGGITERIPLQLSADIKERSSEMPSFLRDLVEGPPDEVADLLAKEFEDIERNEQRRLQGIMEWHSKGCQCLEDLSTPGLDVPGVDKNADARQRKDDKLKVFPQDLKRMTNKGELSQTSAWNQQSGEEENYFPFSITVGVERGAKNRYKNIWPYDFSRVRLAQVNREDGSDYINANFIQPHGTSRRYIATQGPMDATFQDFWTLVWEQDINVIVMLTKQFEGGSIKCGSYWTDGTYGSIKLELLSTEGEAKQEHGPTFGFNFPAASSDPAEETASTIHRHFLLTNISLPKGRPRHLTQIQCVSWPDFDVPSDPRTLLSLLKDVDQAGADVAVQNGQDSPNKPPVLVHCSAGVGRTGGYIVVDAILDGLRREHSLHARKIRGSTGSMRAGHRKHSLADDDDILQRRRGSTASTMSLDIPSPDSAAMQPTMSLSPDALSEDSSREPVFSSFPRALLPYDGSPIALLDSTDPRNPDQYPPSSPALSMAAPVRHVLEGIRVQRMSLCQSLRQYLFVYRAIITGYLDMLDEERVALHADGARGGTQYGSATSAGITDDEGNHKRRRASPTDAGGSRLTKRPSIKLRNSAARAARNTVQAGDNGPVSPSLSPARTASPAAGLLQGAEQSPHSMGEFQRAKSGLSNLAVAMDTSEE